MQQFLLLLMIRSGWFADGRFLGRVLDEWSSDAQEFVRLKLPHLLVVVAIAFVLIRLLRAITSRMIYVAEQHTTGPARIGQVKTLAGVIRTTGLAVIGVIAGLQILDAVGVNLAPLLASAGVAGIAIGLAAQNIVKDMMNGVLLLIEDQINIGDQVRIAGVSGVVETMTLRKTTIRDADGTVYIVPNSQITTVANLSKGFSVATVNVSIDFSANPDAVQKLLAGIALDVRNSESYRDLFADDPKILGIDAVKGSEIIFSVVFKTLANKQYEPLREFRRRVCLALEANHLLPGDPNRVFSFTSKTSPAAEPVRDSQPPAQDPTSIHPQSNEPFSSE